MKSGTRPPLRSTRLLDQLRERISYAHYSLRTEQANVYWVRSFVHFHGLRHPRQMGAAEVEEFLTWLANRHSASVLAHGHALAGPWKRHPHDPGTTGTQPCGHDDDLHACAEP